VHDNNAAVCVSSVTSFAQKAALVALDHNMNGMIDGYRRKRDLIYDGIKDKYNVVRPKARFFIFPEVPGEKTAWAFVERALENNLFIIPGSVFSSRDSHVRISFAASEENLQKGIEVLEKTGLKRSLHGCMRYRKAVVGKQCPVALCHEPLDPGGGTQVIAGLSFHCELSRTRRSHMSLHLPVPMPQRTACIMSTEGLYDALDAGHELRNIRRGGSSVIVAAQENAEEVTPLGLFSKLPLIVTETEDELEKAVSYAYSISGNIRSRSLYRPIRASMTRRLPPVSRKRKRTPGPHFFRKEPGRWLQPRNSLHASW